MDDASVEPKVMPLGLLREITDGFSEDRKLGSGSFGKVYEGVYQNGEKIAVKRLYDMPGLDEKQFQNEFKHLARLRHPNIVRLVGYCHDIQEVQVHYEGKLVLAEKTHRALCLEFMSNGSLEKLLSDECERYDWHTCYRIIKGICQGLKYLHDELEPPIYHLDLKPANVLLDENMVPRIADFGISRLFSHEQTWATQSSLGTLGYSPPEFMRSKLISNKFDIFSFGVVIIKMMAGRAGYFSIADMSSQEFTNIVQEKWTNRLLETSNRRNAYSEQVKICIQIGLSCVQEDRHQRPTIQNIIYRLEESEINCTAAERKDSPVDKDRREGDLVRVFADSESKITCGERIPPLTAMSMFIEELYQESANVTGSNAKFHLRFLHALDTPPVYAEKNITSESNSAIRVGIFDGDGNMIKDRLLLMAKVEVLNVQQAQFMEDLEGKLEKMEGNLDKMDDKIEGIQLKAKKLACLYSSPRDDQQPRLEQSTTASRLNAKFHLRFLELRKTPIYTEKSITSESNLAIRIGIFDGDGNMVMDGPLSKVKVEMLILRGDFCSDGWESWTEEEFNSHIAQGQHGQGFVLGGDCTVWLNNGEASFSSAIRFKEGSSMSRSRMFFIAARVCMDGKTADRVQKAVMISC